MQYVIIENFNGNINLVTNEEGQTTVFDTLGTANEAAEDCQNGIVVPLAKELMQILTDCWRFIGTTARYELGGDCLDDDLEAQLTKLIY